MPPGEVPLAECLKDVVERLLPYWTDSIAPDLRAGLTVLVGAHGNSLRALVKHLDDISDRDIVDLNIPTGEPLVYDLDDDLRPLEAMPVEERYLRSPEEIRAAAEAVARQADAPDGGVRWNNGADLTQEAERCSDSTRRLARPRPWRWAWPSSRAGVAPTAR